MQLDEKRAAVNLLPGTLRGRWLVVDRVARTAAVKGIVMGDLYNLYCTLELREELPEHRSVCQKGMHCTWIVVFHAAANDLEVAVESGRRHLMMAQGRIYIEVMEML